MSAPAIHVLDSSDTIGVALRDLSAGETFALPEHSPVTLRESVPRGHKVAITAVGADEPVTKYGTIIGLALRPIAVGEHVHEHNLKFIPSDLERSRRAPEPLMDHPSQRTPPLPERRTFQGYRRTDDSVGTRNYLAVISTVNCSATVVRKIAAQAEARGLLERFPTIDGIVAITHDQGCGHGGSLGIETLRRTLRGYATHPNVGGVVLVGLGCEMNLMEGMLDDLELRPGVPLASFTVQEIGGTKAAIEHGVAALESMAPVVADVAREEIPVSELVLGLNCGGSDGWSGLTANPALGHASDLIVAQGGRSVLAETPEIYGAEQLLIERAVRPDIAEALLDRLTWWEEYTAAAGGSLDNNPSPGNKDGGITTILEKSLGAVAKAGSAPLTAVYEFAEPITERGLSFMDTPGYDPVSVTGLIAGGCTLIAFTTGRGSAIGTRPSPTVKLSTNSDTYRRMRDDMDLDCGDIVERGVSIEEKGLEIYNLLLDIASGEPTKSEELGYGENEFVPWQLGAVT